MEENIKEIMSIHKQLVKRMASLNGTLWKEFISEVHFQYNEMPFLFLLYEDSDIQLVHKKFCEIVTHCIDKIAPIQIKLFYCVIREEKGFCIENIVGNEAVLSALGNGELGKSEFPLSEGTLKAFKSTDSKRET